MKILFTIGTLGGGGAERNVSLLANAFVEDGNEVGILTIWGDEVAFQLDSRIKYMTLNVCNYRYIHFFQRIYKIRQQIKEYNPDLIISFLADVNACVLLRTRFLNCKVIISERSDPYIEPTIQFFRILRKVTYCFADGYVFQTPDAREYFKSTIRNKKSVIIPNPVKSDLPIHKDNDSHVIVTASRLELAKNIPMLISSFEIVLKQIPDCQLHIYGNGSLKSEIQHAIDEKGLKGKVHLLGFCTDVCEKIDKAEIFVLSSNYEGMSNAMLEALAMGMPVVVTDCPIGGARMMINNGENGILVPVDDAEAMAKALVGLLKDSMKREKIGKKALEIRINNSVNETIDKWKKFINNVMG